VGTLAVRLEGIENQREVRRGDIRVIAASASTIARDPRTLTVTSRSEIPSRERRAGLYAILESSRIFFVTSRPYTGLLSEAVRPVGQEAERVAYVDSQSRRVPVVSHGWIDARERLGRRLLSQVAYYPKIHCRWNF